MAGRGERKQGDTKSIWCCACESKVDARLTSGKEVYPHRADLHPLPFWKHDVCGNSVGCHHKHHDKKMRTEPTGIIATPELKAARIKIHGLIDPIWKSKIIPRARLYKKISAAIGWNYHTATIRNIEEARKVYRAALEIINEMKLEK